MQPRYITDMPLAREADRQARERRIREERQPTPFDCAAQELRAWLANPEGPPPVASTGAAVSDYSADRKLAWAMGWNEAISVVAEHMKEQRRATA
ncbi:hypothetical protein E4P35_14340 [Thiopseudomonas sp. 4R-3cl]|nr:hypothetical protein E4P35_14340 [Thiopseudomonas sp. 4R-3cl]